ncbi:hypothetical protein B0H10DRAFT_2195493, partial [Mycena sp. CBHHK59/15]
MIMSELRANGDLFDYIRNVSAPQLNKVVQASTSSNGPSSRAHSLGLYIGSRSAQMKVGSWRIFWSSPEKGCVRCSLRTQLSSAAVPFDFFLQQWLKQEYFPANSNPSPNTPHGGNLRFDVTHMFGHRMSAIT